MRKKTNWLYFSAAFRFPLPDDRSTTTIFASFFVCSALSSSCRWTLSCISIDDGIITCLQIGQVTINDCRSCNNIARSKVRMPPQSLTGNKKIYIGRRTSSVFPQNCRCDMNPLALRLPAPHLSQTSWPFFFFKIDMSMLRNSFTLFSKSFNKITFKYNLTMLGTLMRLYMRLL